MALDSSSYFLWRFPKQNLFPHLVSHIYMFWIAVYCVCMCARESKFLSLSMCITCAFPPLFCRFYFTLYSTPCHSGIFLTDGRNKHTAFFIGLLHSPLNYWEIRPLGKHETSRSPALCWAVMRWQEMGNGTLLAPAPATVGVPPWSTGKLQNFCISVW